MAEKATLNPLEGAVEGLLAENTTPNPLEDAVEVLPVSRVRFGKVGFVSVLFGTNAVRTRQPAWMHKAI